MEHSEGALIINTVESVRNLSVEGSPLFDGEPPVFGFALDLTCPLYDDFNSPVSGAEIDKLSVNVGPKSMLCTRLIIVHVQ